MAKVKMKVKRLEALADLLENFSKLRPKGKVNMGHFGIHLPDGAVDHEPASGHWCGTSACALGWATTLPELRRAGLKGTWVSASLYPDEHRKLLNISFFDKRSGTDFKGPIPAGARCFGISVDTSAHLFGGHTGTRLTVIKRIRELIEIGEQAYAKKYKVVGVGRAWV